MTSGSNRSSRVSAPTGLNGGVVDNELVNDASASRRCVSVFECVRDRKCSKRVFWSGASSVSCCCKTMAVTVDQFMRLHHQGALRTFGIEAGVGEIGSLGLCLSDFQLGLLKVLLLFLLLPSAGPHFDSIIGATGTLQIVKGVEVFSNV